MAGFTSAADTDMAAKITSEPAKVGRNQRMVRLIIRLFMFFFLLLNSDCNSYLPVCAGALWDPAPVWVPGAAGFGVNPDLLAGRDVFLPLGDQSFTGMDAGRYDGLSANPISSGQEVSSSGMTTLSQKSHVTNALDFCSNALNRFETSIEVGTEDNRILKT